jgi:hypothetical protein
VISVKDYVMDRVDAKLIHEAGQEAVIITLQQQCEQIKKLEKLVASLRQNSTNSSRPPSSDGPGAKKKTKKEHPEKSKAGNPDTRVKNVAYCPLSKWIKFMIAIPNNAKNAATTSLMIKKIPPLNPPGISGLSFLSSR